MSFVSANDHPTPVSPHDPLYYAPPSLRNKADPRSKEVQQMGSYHLPATSSVSHSDKMREEAFAKFTRSLEPEFVYERGGPRALIAIAGGIGAAIAATAIGAFVFFTVSPKSKSRILGAHRFDFHSRFGCAGSSDVRRFLKRCFKDL